MDFDSYLEWLKAKVDPFDDRGRHNFLFRILFNKEAYAVLDNDNNRIKDGLRLREIYFGELPPNPYFPYDEGKAEEIYSIPCSCLEFLIGIARRMNFAYSYPHEDFTAEFFWEILNNAGIPYERFYDESFVGNSENYIIERLDRVLERQFGSEGEGGLFPLHSPTTNQRNQEIWHQMGAYIREKKVANGREET